MNYDLSILQNNPIFALKLKPIVKFMDNPELVEIRVNKPKEIVLEYSTKKVYERVEEFDLDYLTSLGQELADYNSLLFNEENPILSAKLPGGSRVQIMGYTTVSSQFAMSIRIRRYIDFKLGDFGIDKNTQKEIISAVENKKTILVSGGTGTGKTSLTNVLLSYIPKEERLVSIEDVEELRFEGFKDVVNMFYSGNKNVKTKVGAEDLLRSSLRMNPDRILVGEIHVENAETFCGAINTGHKGSIGTIHANSPKGAIAAIIMKIIMNGANDSSIKVLQHQICEDIFAVLQIHKNSDGSRTAEFVKLSEFKNDTSIEKDLTNKISGI